MTKVLVLDSCVFRGISQVELRRSAKDHCLVLSYVLAVESLATQSGNPVRLLHMFEDLVRAGAYYGRSPLKLYEEEKQNLSPAGVIIDLGATDHVRKYTLNDAGDYLKLEAECYRESVVPIVEGVLALAEALYNNVTQRDLLHEMRQEANRPVRLKKWVMAVDKLDNGIMATVEPDLASHWTHDWYTWHNARLRWVLAFDWACTKAQSGSMPTLEVALHDFHDMQHVAYLSKADGLLTRDSTLVEPLARAAFPSKDLFSDIGHVTPGYRFAPS